jgi:hypothetical protein
MSPNPRTFLRYFQQFSAVFNSFSNNISPSTRQNYEKQLQNNATWKTIRVKVGVDKEEA